MKIYYAPNTRAVRVVWLCKELELAFELERFQLGDAAMRTPEFKRVHPLGRVPAIVDGEVTLYESGAIVEYILARHAGGRMRPAADSSDFPAYLQWLHYAEGMIMPPVNTIIVETVLLPAERRNETNVKRATKLLGQMLGAVDERMADREFLAGDFSGADIMTGHACIVAEKLGADLSDKPAVSNYIERLKARPALAASWDA